MEESLKMKLKELEKYIYTLEYDELSDYGKGLRDLLNLINKSEHFTQSDIIKEEGRLRARKKEGLKIPLSEEDLEELRNGEEFHWEFDGVPVHLFSEEEE
jgi:hypothetical protein